MGSLSNFQLEIMRRFTNSDYGREFKHVILVRPPSVSTGAKSLRIYIEFAE